MSRPLVSVVIPARDRATELPRALDSVVAQSLPPHEVVVVDDGSTDTTVIVARQHSIGARVVEGHANGAGAARNLGASRCTGDFLAFLDSDDEWAPEFLEATVEQLTANPSATMCVTDYRMHYTAGGSRLVAVSRRAGMLVEDLVLEDCVGPTSTVLVSHAAFENAGGFDEELPARQDFDLWLRLAPLGPIVRVMAPLVARHETSHAITSDPSNRRQAYRPLLVSAQALASRVDVDRRHVWARHVATRSAYEGAVGSPRALGLAILGLILRPSDRRVWELSAKSLIALTGRARLRRRSRKDD